MSNLRNFILREEARTDLADRYLTYLERYDADVSRELRTRLESEWSDTVAKLNKDHPLPADVVNDVQLSGGPATLKSSLVTTDTKLRSPKFREPEQVSPSVIVPAKYSAHDREHAHKLLLTDAVQAMRRVTDAWSEIFRLEHRGRTLPAFKIVNEDGEVKLQLVTSVGGQTSYKTLYAVRVEPGRASSKTRDYDLVYFTSLTRP